jgi:hypothetical protein
MSTDVLRGLEPAGPAAESIDHIEALVFGAGNDLVMAVETMKGSALLFEDILRRIFLEVAGGQTHEIQADRSRLLTALEKRIDLLKLTYHLTGWLRKQGKSELPDPEALLAEVSGLECLKADVFDRWRTAEDLERLAVERYPLSRAELQRIAATHTPPPEWYAAEDESLFPDQGAPRVQPGSLYLDLR